jgi:ATP-dependent DNA ligase
MVLAVQPPLAPMLARLVREVPRGAYTYEPKWDGFRCLAFVSADGVDLRSRQDRPLARFFPELTEAFEDLRADVGRDFVLDGEIVLDPPRPFADLMNRLHPAASRVARLRVETPTRFVAFDLLALGEEDCRSRPFRERRGTLARILAAAGSDVGQRIRLTPATSDPDVAARWLDRPGSGIDGVVAKPVDLPYEPGRRTMIKVKEDRTAECVVAGWRPLPDATVSSLLLGLYDGDDELRHVGVVTQLPADERVALVRDLAPLRIPLDEHPWSRGFLIGASPVGRLKGSAARWTPDMEHDWVPIRPERVAEVGYDQVDVDRFRHPARFRRWRLDRTAESCRLEQILTGPDSDLLSDRAAAP